MIESMPQKNVSIHCFDLNLPQKDISNARICEIGTLYLLQDGGYDAKIKPRLSKSSLFEVKMVVEFIRLGISV